MTESDVLVTKLTIPPLRSLQLPRKHLLTVLDQSRLSPLTLLSASAGFGKTTLLSGWAKQSTVQVAWLTLDEQDDDPTRFWTYVIAALRHSSSRLSAVGEATLALLQAPQPPLLRGALTTLINELTALGQETALILDDYHLLNDPTIHESLQFFLEHLPPCLHLLLASRGDPPLALARLRARGQMVEVREADLRLHEAEVATFLTQVMGLALSPEAIQLLEARTEGWIAGLQLAALSLRRHDDVSAFLQAFSGSHRLILDYVHEEILEPLPEGLHRFLLQTSVLTRMNAEVCQTLTGEQASQQILEALERANLFLIPLDEERRWYRMHTLFREVLLARLQVTQPEQVSRLHREAARWYQQQDWPHEAITHALASQDFLFVADLLESYTERLFLQGEAQTLLTWIKRLPQEILRAHPRLATNYILSFNLLYPFSPQQQEEQAYLQQLQAEVELVLREHQSTFSEAERNRLRRRLDVLAGWEVAKNALSDGDEEQLIKLAEQVQDLSLDDDTMWQQNKLAPIGMAWRMAGNFPPMVEALQEARKMIQMTPHRSHEVHLLWGLIVALIALGQLRQAQECCQELQQMVKQLGEPLPLAAYPDLFQAQLAYTWNHLEEAKHAAEVAIEKTTPLQYMDTLMGAYDTLVHVCLAQGDLIGAEQAIHAMERLYRSTGIQIFRPWIESLQAQLWLVQGHLMKAADWAEHASYLLGVPTYSREGAFLVLARVYLAQQHYPQALQVLSTLRSLAEKSARVGSIISILALQVATLQSSGATQEALRGLQRLLSLSEPEGYLRVFLDAGLPMQQALQALLTTKHQHDTLSVPPMLAAYASTVLAVFEGGQRQAGTVERIALPSKPLLPQSSQGASPLLEPLTQREQEVLRLLAEGDSNQEIARKLVVSLATAKKHVASILSKLGAENRTQAIAHARSHSLL